MPARKRGRFRLAGVVQRSYVPVRGIVNKNLLCLRPPGASSSGSAPGPHDTYCAVVEVSPINFLLRSEEEQADIIAGFGAWLNSLRLPVQILVQVRRLDLQPYVKRLQDAVTSQVESDAVHHGTDVRERWLRLAGDHVAFVEELARRKLLLERHFYVLLSFEGETSSTGASVGLFSMIRTRLAHWRRRKPGLVDVHDQFARDDAETGEQESRQDTSLAEVYPAWQRQAAAEQQLDLRVTELTRQFDRLGLQVQRLEGAGLAGLYYRALTPERATGHPLPPNVVDGFERDLATLAELVGPASVELAPSHLCLEGEYSRILAATGYPRRVFAGWLARIIDEDMPLDVSLHVHPRDARAALATLRRHLAQYQASAALDLRMGRLPDPQRRIAIEDVTRLQERIERGVTHVFDFGLYLRLYTSRQGGLAQLEHRTEEVHGALDHLGVVARPALWEQDLALASILPQRRDALHRTRFFDTDTIATAWPFSTSSISMSEGILFGLVPANGSFVILDPFADRFENANQVVFGVSGGGKSYATKLRVIRSLITGISSIIVDPENEYRRLCLELGGQFLRLAPGSSQHINPFDLPSPYPDVSRSEAARYEDEDPLADKIQSLHAFFDLLLAERGPGLPGALSRSEKALLDQVIYAAYLRAGITSDRRTHARPAPLLSHVYQVLTSSRFRNEDTTGLASRLHRYVDGALSRLFAAPTDVELDNRLVVFSIADLDEELRPLGLYLVSDCLWTHVRREQSTPRPRLLLVDEAWSLLQFPEGGRFLSSLVRRARKRFLGVVTISQDINDFLGSDWGQTILKNSATKLLMKQDESSIDLIADTFKLSTGERRQLLASAKGEGLLFALGARIAIRVEASPDEHALATTDPHDVGRLQVAADTSKSPVHGEAMPEKTATVAVSRTPPPRKEVSAELYVRPRPWVPAVPSAFVAMQSGNRPDLSAGGDPESPPADPLTYLPSRHFERVKTPPAAPGSIEGETPSIGENTP